MAGCSTCPDMVQSILVNDVVDTLKRVRQIKRLVTIVNQTITDANQTVVNEIYQLISLIPHPPVIDIQYLINLITCPLTAQAILVETADKIVSKCSSGGVDAVGTVAAQAIRESAILATLDPRALLRKIAKIIDDTIKSFWRLIDEALISFGEVTGAQFSRTKKFQFSPEACVVFRMIRRVCMEIASAIRKPQVFLANLAITTASVGLVRATCPELYFGSQFEEFTNEMSTFSFDGILPPGLSDLAKPYIEAFMMLLVRIGEWQAAALLVALAV